jgi:radical SAM superfamily enzyme YgiQ (UPF0313 family)
MSDILLVESPQWLDSSEKADVPPLGLAYMAAIAESGGFSPEILDLNIEHNGFEKKIKKTDLIGISCYTHNYHYAQKLLRIAKSEGKTVVLGGPHATPMYKEVLSQGFDYVIRGEGEYPLINLLKGGGDFKGLSFMENGIPKANPVMRVKDLDSLPNPSRHLLDLKKYSFPGAISTTRGCSNFCIFCSSRNQSGCLRARSIEGLEKEIKKLQSQGIEQFFITDPNFAYNKGRTLGFCKMAKKLRMDWFTELRLNHMDDEVISKMSEAGCKVVRFGIESGSQRVIDLIRKGISIKNIEKIITAFKSHNIVPVCGFMIGHPNERRKDFEETLKLAKKIKTLGGEATFAVLTPYPGTYIFKNAEKLGVKILSKNWEEYHHLNPVIETRHFTRDQLREMLFDALIEISEIKLPDEYPEDSERREILKISERVERKSFRKICLEV